ncbi:MAG: cytotoxin [Betaproteobacteria bacterium]|nr:cytotoxin [Betaproteobacteria bacterium]
MRAWRIAIAPLAAERIRALHPDLKHAVRAALDEIARNPDSGSALQRELAGLRKYRVRRYRLVFRVVPALREIRILAFGHRSSIYEEVALAVRAR